MMVRLWFGMLDLREMAYHIGREPIADRARFDAKPAVDQNRNDPRGA